ncbi:MAG: hypothetical protein HXY19_06275, partial [Thermoanaerobaculaceae bacterium]|nr:hypothetical protein [Thermoanaerobaculaceae bacterium]
MSSSSRRDRIGALVGLGFAAGTGQAVLVREAMAAAGGSELSWGVVLFLWLAGMALGARVGARRGEPRLALWAPVLVVALAGAGVVWLRSTPRLVGAAAGESVVMWNALWVWAVALLPGAAVGGWCFPVLVEGLGDRRAAGTAYALEGLGATLGGLAFTWLLAPLGSACTVVFSVGALGALGLWRRGWPAAALAAVVGSAVVAPAASTWLAGAGWRWSGRTGELERWRDTHEQRLEVTAGPPYSLYADGRLVSTLPDPYRADPLGHLVMLLHPAPRRVLAVGVGADGLLPAMLQHPVERIDVVEEDRALPQLLASWLGEELRSALADRRVRVRRSDPVTLVRGSERWDLVLLRDGDPTTLRRNRTRTLEFFSDCRHCLAPGGVLVLRVGVPDTYLGGPGGELLATLASTVRRVFPLPVGVPGEEVMVVCGRDGEVAVTPELLASRLAVRGVAPERFHPAMLPLLVDPARAESLTRFLRTAPGEPNTAAHPRAVALAAARVEGRGSPRLARAVAR